MSKLFDRPITIQKINEMTEDWEDVYNVHASINKAKANNEYLNAGAIQGKVSLVFEVRFFKNIDLIANDTQHYRIAYNGSFYDIIDYDDFNLSHKSVKLLGVSY